MPALRMRSSDILRAIENARAWEPRIQAWAHLAEMDDLAAASSTAAARGTLQGVPFAVKDIIDVAGQPTATAVHATLPRGRPYVMLRSSPRCAVTVPFQSVRPERRNSPSLTLR